MKRITIAIAVSALFLTGIVVQAQNMGRPRVVNKDDKTSSEPLDAPPPLVVEDDEVLKIETNLVTLPVSVLDERGRFISDLDMSDFEVFEDGVKQEIEFFRSVEQPFTVVLLLDLSPSTKYKISEIQDAAISFIDQLRHDDEIIVVTFSRDVNVISRQKSNYHRFRRAIREAKFGDGTSIYQAVAFAMNQELKNIEGRKALVIFSDGVDTSSRGANYQSTIREAEALDSLVYPVWYNTFQEGKATKDQSGKLIYAVGASPEENQRGKDYLRDLTEYAGGKLYEANNIENLNQAFRSIAEELRKQYYIGYYPEIAGKLGDRKKINVRVRRPRLTIRSKTSYRVNF